jgi:hypothetical protein
MTTSQALRRPVSRTAAHRTGGHRTARITDEVGLRFGFAEAALVAALLVASLFRLDEQLTLAVVAATTLAAGALLGPVWAAGLGVSAWAMFTGFSENTLGTLTLASGDLLRLALLVVGCAVVAVVAGATRRWAKA